MLSIWGAAVGLGFLGLMRYSSAIGAPARSTSRHWPDNCLLEAASRGTTLVVVLHPHCPCSQATLGELARVITHGERRGVLTHILFVVPDGMEIGWEDGALLNTARAMPAAQVTIDRGGTIAAQFGARTSGQVFAFDETGALRFSGGVTPARGHMGDSDGSDALEAILAGQHSAIDHAAVFGCALGTTQTIGDSR
jgi:hypothetical protein